MRRCLLSLRAAVACVGLAAGSPDPVVYTIDFPDPASKSFTVTMTVPTGGRPWVTATYVVAAPRGSNLGEWRHRDVGGDRRSRRCGRMRPRI